MRQIYYLTTLHLPSSFANRTQVMKMSEAFAKIFHCTLFVSRLDGNEEEIFRAYGIRTKFPIVVQRATQLWPRSFFAAIAYRNIIKEAPPATIFYVREPLLACMLILISARFRKSFFVEVHSFVRYPWFVYDSIFKKSLGIITTTQIKKEAIKKKFQVSEKKLYVAPNAIDAGDFENKMLPVEARKSLHIEDARPLAVFVGKPIANRGIDLFLEIADSIGDIFQFLSVGGSTQDIDSLRSKKGFSKVRFVSQVPHSDVSRYMYAADILLAPQSAKFADISRYASPMKALEYLASGSPALFSDIPAMHEMIPLHLATFVKADSKDDWIRAMNDIAQDFEGARERAEDGRAYALGCTWDARAENITQFMEVCRSSELV